MKSQQNNICVCGHLESEHKARWKNRDCIDTIDICLKCLPCMVFKLDNLRFLENLCYEKETTKA
jgi:hypothetical protein